MTITQAHRDRLKALHARDPKFGVIGHLWAPEVSDMMADLGANSLLDYGAGRSGLAAAVVYINNGIIAHEYEPAFGHTAPDPADFVTCIDVMEHVESDQVEAVFADIKRCATMGALITISLRAGSPAKKAVHPNVWPRHKWIAALTTAFGLGWRHEQITPLDPSKAASELCVILTRLK